MSTINFAVENTAHLTKDEQACVRCKVHGDTLDRVEAELRAAFGPSWFVYRGGGHVALHRAAGDDRRVAVYTEANPEEAPLSDCSLEFKLAAMRIDASERHGYGKSRCIREAANSLVAQGWSVAHSDRVAAFAWDRLFG